MDPSPPIEPPTLEGRLVRLEALGPGHAAGLLQAIGDDRSTFRWTSVPEGADGVWQFIRIMMKRQATGEVVPFAQVRLNDGLAVGSTSYLSIRHLPGAADPYAVEIGHTWLGAAAQRSGINTEAKLLLLTHAFERWGVARVDLKTDARNDRSRAAIERLGARFEGILRNWQPSFAAGEEGLFRNTAMFSITNDEWPATRERLTDLLQRS
jgi:RimJ/RimL family protein N-acetyltransferase